MAASPKNKKGSSVVRFRNTRQSNTKNTKDVAKDEDIEEDDERMDAMDMFKSLEIENKKIAARQKAFQAQKKGLYDQARKLAQEMTQTAETMIDEMKAQVLQYAAAEVSFDTYFQQVYLASLREKDHQAALLDKIPDTTDQNQLGPRRAQHVETAATMLDSLPKICLENEHKYSKMLKADLIAAKKKEKDAEDAAHMIDTLKKCMGHSRW